MQRFLLLSLLLLYLGSLHAQKKNQPAALPRPSQSGDTVRLVEILHADQFFFRTIDSVTQLQILKGNVKIKQGVSYFDADSVVYDERANYMQAFGNVHINDADSVNIYSQVLEYDGNRKLAIFKQKVKLTDGASTLYTDEMDYDMNGKVGTYRNGGRIESKQTTLVSNQGFYYADIKDVYFIGNVKMSDPEVALASDSLLYNTTSQVATFIAPTTIKSGNSVINTREGYYDLKLKKAKFGKRSMMQDSTSQMIADDFAFDDKTGFGEAKGNVRYKDTAQGVMLFSNRVFFNKEKKNFLATEKPVMVVVQDRDSIFIAADTIFSGMIRDLPGIKQGYIRSFDTLSGTKIINIDSIPVKESNAVIRKDTTLTKNTKDTVVINTRPTLKDSTVIAPPVAKEILPVLKPAEKKDTMKTKQPDKPINNNRDKMMTPAKDTLAVSEQDNRSLDQDTLVKRNRTKEETDTLRFITAFRNVRIYNDSLQAVADSMFYSGVDSIFELYHEPIAWSRGSQVTGDTIFVFTENKKPKRLYVYENGFVVQNIKQENDFFNQIRGRTINGYFKDGELDYVRAKGTAESIYYAQDNDSAFVGMNRTTADIIDMFFDKKSPKKVKFISSVKGTTYPIRQLPTDQKKLPGFQWLEIKRPKDKLELFL